MTYSLITPLTLGMLFGETSSNIIPIHFVYMYMILLLSDLVVRGEVDEWSRIVVARPMGQILLREPYVCTLYSKRNPYCFSCPINPARPCIRLQFSTLYTLLHHRLLSIVSLGSSLILLCYCYNATVCYYNSTLLLIPMWAFCSFHKISIDFLSSALRKSHTRCTLRFICICSSIGGSALYNSIWVCVTAHPFMDLFFIFRITWK